MSLNEELRDKVRGYQEIQDSKAYALLRMVLPERSAFSVVWRIFSGPNPLHKQHFEEGCTKLLANLSDNAELTEWLDTERMLRVADQKEIGNLKAQHDAQYRSTLGYFDERYKEAHKILFHDDPTDLPERRNRFLEEVFELVQVLRMPRHEIIKLLDYTYGKKVGVMETELGDVASTFLSLLYQLGIPSHLVFTKGLETLFQKKDKIRAKRRTRHGRGPLPGLDVRPPSQREVPFHPSALVEVPYPVEMKKPPHPWNVEAPAVHDEVDLTRGADEDAFKVDGVVPEELYRRVGESEGDHICRLLRLVGSEHKKIARDRQADLIKQIFTMVEKLANG
jgi:NTP pyrophosphatase (non-canonical NTP hydrolase)